MPSPTAWLAALPDDLVNDPQFANECAMVKQAEDAMAKLMASASAKRAAEAAVVRPPAAADAAPAARAAGQAAGLTPTALDDEEDKDVDMDGDEAASFDDIMDQVLALQTQGQVTPPAGFDVLP